MTPIEPAFPAFRIEPPDAPLIPVVYDSPHSGSIYPADFDIAIDPMLLRRSEDAHVDELFAHVTETGAPLLHALFPRCYIDPNRAESDLDADMIAGDWPHPLAPTAKSRRHGVGLIWRRMKAHGPIYDRRLSAAEVSGRLDRFWRPYHHALRALLDQAQTRFGRVYHVNCHSMAAWGDDTTEDGPVKRPDFVIGDRDGTTCAPAFTELVVEHLRGLGYSVAVNDPYKGFELVRRYADPANGRHSLQIELTRGRYMNEATLTKLPEFPRTEQALQSLAGAIATFARDAVT